MRIPFRTALPTALLLLAGAVALAQIKAQDLATAVAKTDNVVYAEITSREVSKVEDAKVGTLYFTTLTLSGSSLRTGEATQASISYLGGFLPNGEGFHCSEAPSAEDTQVGTRVVAFYKYVGDMGGGKKGNILYGMHAGLFRTVQGPKGAIVLGRGEGAPIAKNVELGALTESVRAALKSQGEKK